MNKWYYLVLLISLFSCETKVSPKDEYKTVSGERMGTYFLIKYQGSEEIKKAVDSIFNRFDLELSTYVPESHITKINQSGIGDIDISQTEYFEPVFRKSARLVEQTEGYFLPTVKPLLNYWGFGEDRKQPDEIDLSEIERLMTQVSFQNFELLSKDGKLVIRKNLGLAQLNFNAIAKGYAVDVVGDYLNALGVKNYLVDIGGEQRILGVNEQGKKWSIGLNVPKAEAKYSDMAMVISVGKGAIASSGNYRDFYTRDGVKFGHIINPKTGLSETKSILGATVISEECAIADAWATASMAMGLEKAKELIEKANGVEACFFYNDNDSLAVSYTTGFDQYIKK